MSLSLSPPHHPSAPRFFPFSSEIPTVYQWHSRDAGGCPRHCNANARGAIDPPRYVAKRTGEKPSLFMGILETRKITVSSSSPRKILFLSRERHSSSCWKNYEMKARLTLILNNSRSTLILGERYRPTDRATDSPDYRSNYLARHDRATPSSGDGIAVPTVLRVTRPPSTTEVIVTSLLPFSTVFEPISTRDDSYDFRHPRHGSPEQTLSLSLSFYFSIDRVTSGNKSARKHDSFLPFLIHSAFSPDFCGQGG